MAKLSFQTTVTTSGVAYLLGSDTMNSLVLIKALPTNAGVCYIGNDGTNSVSSTTGYPLSAGEAIMEDAGSLSGIYVTSTVSGDKVAVIDATV